MSSLNLYVEHFEFNAGIYYGIRAISPIWNDTIVFWVGRLLTLSFLLFYLYRWIQFRPSTNRRLLHELFWVLFAYILLAKVVHPWYITPILALSILSGYRLGVLWSILIFLTYITYAQIPYQENLLIVFMEYIVLIGFAVWEIYFRKRPQIRNEYG